MKSHTSQTKSKTATRLAAVFIGLAVLMICVLAGAAALGTGVALTLSRGGDSARVETVSGTVEMSAADGSGVWQTLASGDRVHSGQRLRTAAGSNATLVFADGSQTVLGPQADLTLDRVDRSWGGVVHIVMTQNAGKSSHQVIPLRSERSSYLVFTPTGMLSVHGTQFDVAVGSAGQTRYAVDHGKVLVANQSSQVYLTAGQTLLADPEEPFAEPDYKFTLQGVLTFNQGSTWIVSDVPFEVTEETMLVGDVQLNSKVLVEGHILEGGTWVADTITAVEADGEVRSFSGVLMDMEGEEWQVDDRAFLVDENTELGEGLATGLVVEVTFTKLEDGQWLALSVMLQEEEPQEPTPTPTAEPNPEANPILAFDPQLVPLAVCEPQATITASLVNQATEEDDDAVDVVLDYAVLSGGEYVDAVTVTPDMWALIENGASESLTVDVDLAEAWETAENGTFVELRVFIASEANTPAGHTAALDIKLGKKCLEENTPTPTDVEPTATPTDVEPTATPTDVEPTATPTDVEPTATPTKPGDYIDLENCFRITFLGYTVNADGTTTWNYRVDELECAKDLSNWVLEIPACAGIVSAAPSPWEAVSPDPNIGLTGIKWEVGDGFESGQFSVVLSGDLMQGSTGVGAKGPKVALGSITGPVCADEEATETPPPDYTPTPTEVGKPTWTPTVEPKPSETEPAPSGQIVINNNNDAVALSCDGQAVLVTGNHNSITLSGNCQSLVVTKNTNTIYIESVGSIVVSGNKNTIYYGGGSPSITDTGNKNVIQSQ